MNGDLPLVEFDPDREAMIEPGLGLSASTAPERAVLCFFPEVVADATAGARRLFRRKSEDGQVVVHAIDWKGVPLAVAHPGVGAPKAAITLEYVIAAGATRVVVCGGAGSVVPGRDLGAVLVVAEAIRDEGTSFHYLPPSRTVAADPVAVERVVATLEGHGVPFEVGTVWTTDALFRETRGKVEARRDEGAVMVDMEAAALLAVARFRQVRLAQLLYAGDDVSAEVWDHRGWMFETGVRRHLFELAADAAIVL